MKKSHLFSLTGLAFLALTALSACSGTTPTPEVTEGNPSNTESSDPSTLSNNGGNTQNPQDSNKLIEQREAALVAEAIRLAKRNLDLGKYPESLNDSSFALRMDPNNAEAMSLFKRANEIMGNSPNSRIAEQKAAINRNNIEQQRDRARALAEAAQGDALLKLADFDKAVDKFRRAVTILEFSVFYSKGSALMVELQAKLKDAEAQLAQAVAERIKSNQSESEAAQQKQERILVLAKRSRIKRLFEDANRAFQRAQYKTCLASLEVVLQEDPWHDNALALRQLASRARHDVRMEQLRRKWKDEWKKTFASLNREDVPMTETYRYDLQQWRETLKRGPQVFKSEESEDNPEEEAILAKLNSVKQPFNFPDAALADWARYFSDRTGVSFVVTKGAAEMDPEATTLTNFQLPPKRASEALNIIGDKTGVKWRVMHGVVQLVTAEFAGGRMYLRPYNVSDIVEGVPDKPGIEPKLTVPGEEPPVLGGDDEVRPTVVDTSKLVELIKDNIGGESWEGDGASIEELKNTLMVRQTAEVHKKIRKLLSDLRESVGIQVDVESRFLKVTDNFLEDIGIDFRGLGNNAAEGIPGRGLANRPNVGFDDFGRRENVNPAAPGTVGTGSEPGIFYDDGNDGDIFGRVENLFDGSLGDDSGLNPSGGTSIQYAFLDDAEVEMIFRAVTKNDRSQEITAPRLLVYNNTRANMSVARQTTYIKDFDVEIAQAAAVANPVIGIVRDGVALDVRPVVSADRRFITMELRPTVLDLTLPIPTFTTTLGVGQPIKIQLPETTLKQVRTTVTLPDGGTVLLGGMKVSNKRRLESGVPILSQIPIISFFFSRKGTSVTNHNLLILIRASIVIPSEHEPVMAPNPNENYIGGGR